MAKASRVAVRTQRTLEEYADQLDAIERRLIRIEAVLDAMLTKAQREKLAAMLDSVDDETEAIEDEPETA